MKKTLISLLLVFLLPGCVNNNLTLQSSEPSPTATVIESRNYIKTNGGIAINFSPKDDSIIPTDLQFEQLINTMDKRLNNHAVVYKVIEINKASNSVSIHIPWEDSSGRTPVNFLEELSMPNLLTFKDPDGLIVLEGKDVENAYAKLSQHDNTPIVVLVFNSEGKQKFADATTRLINQKISINMDSTLLSDPTVQQAITGGEAIISGLETLEDAQTLAAKINSGATPYELTFDWDIIEKEEIRSE